MKETVSLHIPTYGELWYRQRLLQDPETMRYNRGYDLNFEGYDKETGCIAFPERDWADWYGYFIGQEPLQFYAYIVRESDGAFIGEVNLRKNQTACHYDMGIVLEAKFRGNGYAESALQLLLQHAFENMNASAVRNVFEAEREAALRLHLAVGFTIERQENAIAELQITKEQYARQKAIRHMTSVIREILADRQPSVYLYGSCVLNDFRLGWSDIDLLVLTQEQITQKQAEELVMLRQRLSENDTEDPYYRLFEGGMLTLSAFLSKEPDRVVYWGTTGQRIAGQYSFDSFCMAELLQNGRLLYGEEIRDRMATPVYDDLCADVKKHYEGIRRCAKKTERSFYSFGWLLDIARGLYTLRNGTVTSKTEAAQWALEQNLCPVPDALETALRVRKNPLLYREDAGMLAYAETLGFEIQRFADVLEKNLEQYYAP